MKLIPIEDVLEGMVIAQDIISSSGQCLISKKTILTGSLIKNLRRHNITKLPVEDNSGEDDLTDKEITRAEEICSKKVLEGFYEEPADSMMKVIFKTALRVEAIEYLRREKQIR